MGAGGMACAEIAEKQSVLISQDQASRMGMSERAISRRLGACRWCQVLPGSIAWRKHARAGSSH